MNLNDAITILVQTAQRAQKSGALSLEDAVLVFEATQIANSFLKPVAPVAEGTKKQDDKKEEVPAEHVV